MIMKRSNDVHEGRGSTKTKMKKKDGYSRVPLDALLYAALMSLFLNKVADILT